MKIFCRYLFVFALALSSSVFAQDVDPRLCSAQGDPVAEAPFNLVDSYCIPSSVALGDLGGPASIHGEGVFPTNADGQLDVFIIWEPGQIASSVGESFSYSSSLNWASSQPDAVYKEWVGNFVPADPNAFLITDSSNPGLTPPQLVLGSSSGTVTDRIFEHAQFPPVPLGRYHIQVTGLEPFEDVTFTKTAGGAHVSIVPEPSSWLSGFVALLGISLLRRRR